MPRIIYEKKRRSSSRELRYRHLPCFSFEKAGKHPGIRNNRLLRFLTNIVLLSTVNGSSCTNGEQKCLQWEEFPGGNNSVGVSWEDFTLGKENDYLGNEGVYACRVMQVDEDERCKFQVGITINNGESQRCKLFHHQSEPEQQLSFSTFQVARGNKDICHYYWMPISYDVNPLNPNAIIVGSATEDLESPELFDIAICRHDRGDGVQRVGRMFRNGKFFGQCSIHIDGEEVMIGGGYESLSAWLVSDEIGVSDDTHVTQSKEAIETYKSSFSEIARRVELFLEEEDKQIISAITGYPFEQLMEALGDPDRIGISVMKDILSMKRFLPHHLNLLGLSLLRSVLAERMINARRAFYGLDQHPDAAEWKREGVLLKDYDYYLHPDNQEEFQLLLQMCSASKPNHIPSTLTWVEKNVFSDRNDPQLQAHIDTFHSVVKIWVYQRGDVTIENGPLHFMRGSSQNNEAKLRWIYSVTIPPSIEAMKEPSLRYNGNATNDGMSDELRPVLPLEDYKRTLIIADTSGIHHRGHAVPGTVRRTIRVQDNMQGGVPRLDPFEWSGWETWEK